MTEDGVILATRDLVKEYVTGSDTVRALDGVTFEVPRGRFVAVMGPSGSGKSTLLHLLGGLDRPTSGDVFLDGISLSALGDKAVTLARRNKIGFVFQFFNLVPVLSVEENISLPAVIDGKKPREYTTRLDQVLEMVGLTRWRSHLPSEISGGQQQRVAIARALFTEPAVMLADEPTGNLDSRNGTEILQLMKHAQRELGQTTIVVTHDSRAASFADEIVLLEDGKIRDRLEMSEAGDDRETSVLDWLQAART